jgi:FkbM family methyltransferase
LNEGLLLEANHGAYTVLRISLAFLGKRRRDFFLRRIWRDRYNLPNPVFASLPRTIRQRWIRYYWKWRITKAWEPQVMRYVQSLHGHLLVDVGANIGFYCGKLCRNFVRLIAIEADPLIYSQLIEMCPSNCEPINAVVSDTEGQIDFYAPREGMNVGRGSIFLPGEQKWSRGIDVASAMETVSLQKFPLSKILANEEIIDLIKVDVEGAEWLVIKGAEPIMSRISRWVIELHDLDRKVELEDTMRKYGYRVKWLDAGHLGCAIR